MMRSVMAFRMGALILVAMALLSPTSSNAHSSIPPSTDPITVRGDIPDLVSPLTPSSWALKIDTDIGTTLDQVPEQGRNQVTLTRRQRVLAKILFSYPPSQSILTGLGCLLAWNSGYVNGLTLSGLLFKDQRKQTVAAVTGAYTLSALNPQLLGTQFTVILSYMIGSAINGYLQPHGVIWISNVSSNSHKLIKMPSVAIALLISATLVSAAYLSVVQQYAVPAWLCLAMALGLQNSWTSSLISGNVLRTAHISGITSDMGSIIGQVLGGNKQNQWKLRIFASLIASFWLGAALCLPIHHVLQHHSLLFSVGLYVAVIASLLIYHINAGKWGDTTSTTTI